VQCLPNCGGGFVQRPVRPAQDWKNGNFLGSDPASKTLKHRPVDLAVYAKLVAVINGLPPEKRWIRFKNAIFFIAA
jgi:uncharacterized protein